MDSKYPVDTELGTQNFCNVSSRTRGTTYDHPHSSLGSTYKGGGEGHEISVKTYSLLLSSHFMVVSVRTRIPKVIGVSGSLLVLETSTPLKRNSSLI